MQTTENYDLPIFEEGETPALVGDWNSTMRKIDNIGGGSGGGVTIEKKLYITDYTPNEINAMLEEYDMVVIGGGHISIPDDNILYRGFTSTILTSDYLLNDTGATFLCYTRLGGNTSVYVYYTLMDRTFNIQNISGTGYSVSTAPFVYCIKF